MTHNACKKFYHDMQEEEKEANANGEFFLNSLATPYSTLKAKRDNTEMFTEKKRDTSKCCKTMKIKCIADNNC